MQNLLVIICLGSLLFLPFARADDHSSLDYAFALSFEKNEIENLSLGDDPMAERLTEKDLEFEFDLEYTVNDRWSLFFTGSIFDETETVKPAAIEDKVSGIERKQMGVAYLFGEEVESELKIGRVEFTSASEWWLWWDEELDSTSLDSGYRELTALLVIAEERARESTGVDFIDPEIEDQARVIAGLSWEFAAQQSLNLYYLDQADNSSSHLVGEFTNAARLDEEDADLRWTGISYLGGFDFDKLGEIELELHYAKVSGDETVYEFDDPAGGIAEVIEKEKNRVSGTARSYLLSWTPAALDDWSFIVGNAWGSGDNNPGDNRVESFRQTGLQGESAVFGELYQPEISNLEVQAVGIEWEFYDGFEIALLNYDYRQIEATDEIRDTSIEADPDGLHRDLGSEIDLVLTFETDAGLELILVAAEFEAGEAYGSNEGDTSSYVAVEVNYEF